MREVTDFVVVYLADAPALSTSPATRPPFVASVQQLAAPDSPSPPAASVVTLVHAPLVDSLAVEGLAGELEPLSGLNLDGLVMRDGASLYDNRRFSSIARDVLRASARTRSAPRAGQGSLPLPCLPSALRLG